MQMKYIGDDQAMDKAQTEYKKYKAKDLKLED